MPSFASRAGPAEQSRARPALHRGLSPLSRAGRVAGSIATPPAASQASQPPCRPAACRLPLCSEVLSCQLHRARAGAFCHFTWGRGKPVMHRSRSSRAGGLLFVLAYCLLRIVLPSNACLYSKSATHSILNSKRPTSQALWHRKDISHTFRNNPDSQRTTQVRSVGRPCRSSHLAHACAS